MHPKLVLAFTILILVGFSIKHLHQKQGARRKFKVKEKPSIAQNIQSGAENRLDTGRKDNYAKNRAPKATEVKTDSGHGFERSIFPSFDNNFRENFLNYVRKANIPDFIYHPENKDEKDHENEIELFYPKPSLYDSEDKDEDERLIAFEIEEEVYETDQAQEKSIVDRFLNDVGSERVLEFPDRQECHQVRSCHWVLASSQEKTLVCKDELLCIENLQTQEL